MKKKKLMMQENRKREIQAKVKEFFRASLGILIGGGRLSKSSSDFIWL